MKVYSLHHLILGTILIIFALTNFGSPTPVMLFLTVFIGLSNIFIGIKGVKE